MAYIKNRIIHRFIRDITEYLVDGICFGQVLPVDTQVYADYSEEARQVDKDGNPKIGLYYVIGDGIHTYTEIRDGHGENDYNKEYMAFVAESDVLKDVYLHNLTDGNFLRWNEELHKWTNIITPPVPLNDILQENEFDCGNATSENEYIIDGGNAGAIAVDLLDSGKVAITNYNIEFIRWI